MNGRIKFEIEYTDPAKLSDIIKDAGGKKYLEIELKPGTIQAQKTGDKVINLTTAEIRGMEVVTNKHIGFKADEIKKIVLVSNNKEDLIVAWQAIILRHELAGKTDKYLGAKGLKGTAEDAANAGQNKWQVVFDNLKYGQLGSERLSVSSIGSDGKRDLFLNLETDFSEFAVLFNYFDTYGDGDPNSLTKWSFKPIADNFDNLKKILSLGRKLVNYDPIDSKLKKWQWYVDNELFDHETVIKELEKYKDYGSDYSATTGSAPEEEKKLKEFFYNLKLGSEEVYKDEINNLKKVYQEIKNWFEGGLASFHQVLIAENSGFKDEWAAATFSDSDEKKIVNGKYKAFDIIGQAKVEKDTTVGLLDIGEKFKITGTHYTCEQIDRFRHADWFKGSVNNILSNSGVTTIDFSNKFEPNDCRGFQPSDIEATGKYRTGRNVNLKNTEIDFTNNLNADSTQKTRLTKIYLDILSAPDLDVAIDLAFFGIPYEDMVGTAAGTREYEREEFLFFNETGTNQETPLQLLEVYFAALADPSCGTNAKRYGTHQDFRGDWSANNYHNKKSSEATIKSKVEIAYITIKNFLKIIIKDYSNKNEVSDAECRVAEGELRSKLKELTPTLTKIDQVAGSAVSNPVKIAFRWQKIINSKLAEIENRFNPNNELVSNAEIDSAKNAFNNPSENAKKIFEAAKGKLKKGNLDKLISLIRSLEITAAKSDFDEEILRTLRDFSAGADEAKKNVWEIIASVKEKSNDGDSWGKKCLDKLESLLKKAKDEAKAVIDKIEKNEAYNQSGINDWTSTEKIKKVKELFELARESYEQKEKNSKVDELKSSLNIVQNKEEWKAVNQYKKNGKGYADDALEYLNSLVEKAAQIHEDFLKITKKGELEAAIVKAAGTITDPEEKKKYLTIKLPMLYGRLDLDEKNETEKELKTLLAINLDKDYDNDQKSLEKIGQDIAKLKAFESAAETDSKGIIRKKADSKNILKTALSEFLKFMENKKSAIEKVLKSQDKPEQKDENSPKSNKGWETWQVLAVFAVVGIILSIFVYFINRSSNDDEKS